MEIHEPLQLPPDLQRWGWTMQQMKSGPRNHPGGWWQFIFWRLHGLAQGDDHLDLKDGSLRVKVRCPSLEEAFAEAIRQMRERSATLQPSDDYDRLMEEDRKRWAEHWAYHLTNLPEDWPKP